MRTVVVARRRGAWAAPLALLLGIVAAPRAEATTVIAKDFSALCAEAELIFVGTVASSESRWSDPQRQAIETVVTFTDLTWLRGGPQAQIELRFGGGELDGLHEAVAGVPQFNVGDRRVVFAHAGHLVSPIVGFNQGLFRVVDGAGGPVVLDADGKAVTGVGRAALQRGAADDRSAALPLDAFLARVREQMAAGPTP
ncbi:MAG TPA: hypothetical protein VL049_06445 [Candidatus Dormibacteraeota bacterium]|nr:hypothetical protein [Candidatus Dormibacteraeota bacterium]